jgi:hypothetical protein
MSLYGRTDSNENKAKVERTISASSQAKTIVFVDETEAALNENRTRGIDGPGWWSYFTYTDASGNTRHKAEKLVSLSNADTNANETQSDDTIAADVASAVVISVQPASATTTAGAATFTLTTTTTGTPGTLAYQWQRLAAGSTRWVNITSTLDGSIYSDFTTDTLAVTGVTDDSYDGYAYRVKVTSAGGTEEVISDGTATLTFDT